MRWRRRKSPGVSASQSPQPGELLEVEVERVYRLLGASTGRRVLIKNYEIDVFATFLHDPIVFRVLVECKDYSKDKKVSDVDMRSFVVKLLAAREAGIAEKGVYVTTLGCVSSYQSKG